LSAFLPFSLYKESFCILFSRHFNTNRSAMYYQPLSDYHYLLHRLITLSKTNVLAAIELLQRRLMLMKNDDYYLHIPLTEQKRYFYLAGTTATGQT
jgi:hypothetical protein